jgi:hemolysin activation/secretion protein
MTVSLGISPMKLRWPRLLWIFIFAALTAPVAVFAEEPLTFEVRSFTVEGNTLLADQTIQETLAPYKGRDKTADDVEKARAALEKTYHDVGYPAVLVNIPEQTTKGGKIRLQVIESKIGSVKVTGNRWFTQESILKEVPSLTPGTVLYVPDVQKDLSNLNRGEDLKVSPILSPGKEIGTTDVELKVEDRLPLHGNIEVNNSKTPNTSDLRLSTSLHYDNLWQRGHSLAVQFQTSPQNTGEVRLYALSYVFPAPWAHEHQIAFYGIRSDTNNTVVGQGLTITGKGEIIGTRYVMPLSPYKTYLHNLTAGLDFRDFEQISGFNQEEGQRVPVKYLPLTFSYNASLPDRWGSTSFSAGLNGVFRGFITDERNFAFNRVDARGNYIYFTGGVERNFKLPWGMGAFLKVDGQIADQPLIPNEQYTAGGMANVRGYKEGAALGDNAFHLTAEISGPEFGSRIVNDRLKLTPYVFYDFARLTLKGSLPGQTDAFRLQGTGMGLKGGYGKSWYYELDYALPSLTTSETARFRQRWYFKVGAQF